MSSLRLKQKTKGLPLVAGALFAVMITTLPASAGFAQNGYNGGYNGGGNAGLNDRLSQIETQIQTLSRSVYRGAPPPAVSGGPVGNAADFEVRFSALEAQVRSLTGQVETANHQAQDAQNRLDRMQADYDARLQQLEHPGAASSTSGAYVAPTTGYNSQANAAAGTSTPDIPPAGKTLGTLSVSGDSPDALYESAFSDVRDSRYDTAESKFKQFLSQYPTNPLAGNAQYWLGETYYVRADYKQAAKTFAQGYQDYPQGSKAADCLLKLGLSLAKMGKKDDACLSFQQLKKEFPSDTVPANRRATQEMKSLSCG